MTVLYCFFVLIIVVSSCICQPTLFLRTSDCPTPSVMKRFKLKQMDGQWYEISRFPSQWEIGKCIQVSYNVSNEDGTVKMRWEQIYNNGSINYAHSVGHVKEKDPPAKLTLKFTKPYNPWETPFWILDTDYNSYAIIYSCYPYFHPGLRRMFNTEFAWVMSRKRKMSVTKKRRLKSSITHHNIYTHMFIDNDQTGCEEYENPSAHFF
ncbi:apolipoprotein D-like [Styela clava]